jgi:hypothetical protein
VLAGIRNESEEFRILLDLQNREKPSAGKKTLISFQVFKEWVTLSPIYF